MSEWVGDWVGEWMIDWVGGPASEVLMLPLLLLPLPLLFLLLLLMLLLLRHNRPHKMSMTTIAACHFIQSACVTHRVE